MTSPGLGCGQFAGPFAGKLGQRLNAAIRNILTRHTAMLSGVHAVWFDPYSECTGERHQIGHITYMVRPLLRTGGRPQLCRPEYYAEPGDDFSSCDLYSVVAWEHVSWPGNDFYAGSRSTDDGVKAAATDFMFAMTGIRGGYSRSRNAYELPAGAGSWEKVVTNNALRITAQGAVVIIRPDEPDPA
ncbi:MAG: hypothetical protein E4H09_03270 [Spirochaetales bacterium]|nr:MAG: hypothetical protein E4H09_03270 [Spirochaetales bacterium]